MRQAEPRVPIAKRASRQDRGVRAIRTPVAQSFQTVALRS